ncbi:NADH-quinone oxidoreductase subunit C [Phycisphaerales bacterium AB-hyl4]|uniref:NADH-quinone oxidoreductase subunit C n=1 Tax=Natronomicrosphaera hydrolytica TaxID=3242702 RepID=A0ABV4TZA2_9BACT
MANQPNLDHPTLPLIKQRFSDRKLYAAEFRGLTTLVVQKQDLHEVMHFLRNDEQCAYDFLSDVTAVDYLNYPASDVEGGPKGRFAVVYNIVSYRDNRRLIVKTYLDPTLDTHGVEDDPALHVDSVTDIWPGAEWSERETFDMFGIRFDNHPDLRRILLWESYPAHPLRKDYPVIGRGEREDYRIIDRDSA